MPTPCFVCGADLPSAFEGADHQPSGATTFRTGGHYGSGAFDPMSGDLLELNICDPCLTKTPERVRLVRITRTEKVDRYLWSPVEGE